MMKNILLYILILIGFLELSAQPCTADFSFSTDSSGLATFQDQSNAFGDTFCSYTWDFGDGDSSSIQSPVHLYDTSGLYTVCLIIQTSSDLNCLFVDCSDTVCYNIQIINNLPCNLSISYTQINVSTIGGNDGSIDLTLDFVSGPITYQWSSGQQTEDISGLSAGIYTILASDTNNCHASATVVITEPLPCALSLSHNQTNVSTNGGNDGSIDLSVLNGSSLVNYLWSNSQTTEDISGLIAGVYTVAVNDTDGCQAFDTITITEPAFVPVEYDLTGQVYAKSVLLPEGVALLINDNYEVLAKTEIISGQYQFLNIDSGQYTVYAVPYFDLDYPYYPKYFPSYFGDETYWASSDFVLLDSDLGVDIHLVYSEAILHAQASISGQVQYEDDSGFETAIYQQNWFNNFKGITAQSASNVTVFLLDENLNIVDFCLSDGMGDYQFNTIPYGSYTIHAEKTGKTTIPVRLSLSQDIEHLDNINLTIKADHIINIEENSISDFDYKLWPNPFTDKIQLESSNLHGLEHEIYLLDYTGRKVLSTINSSKNITINTERLESGIYILYCKSVGNIVFLKKMIKY